MTYYQSSDQTVQYDPDKGFADIITRMPDGSLKMDEFFIEDAYIDEGFHKVEEGVWDKVYEEYLNQKT